MPTTEEIKEKAEEYRRDNGNPSITLKDMFWWLVGCHEELEKKVNKNSNHIESVTSTMNILKWLVGVGIPAAITLLLTILGYIITIHPITP